MPFVFSMYKAKQQTKLGGYNGYRKQILGLPKGEGEQVIAAQIWRKGGRQ
jgi:hypothetical protein